MMRDNNSTSKLSPFMIDNEKGKSEFVILADHAANYIPPKYKNLGLDEKQLQMHIAWDPGSLAVAKILSQMFDAPLIYSTISRLIIDNNRSHDREDLIPKISEYIRIKGNENISKAEHQKRINNYHIPYHNAISDLLDEREKTGMNSIIMSIHSFTPTYNKIMRPWEIGLIPGINEKFTKSLFDALKKDKSQFNVGWNEPYAALHGVHHTMDIHSDKRGLHGSMIEIRNDEIANYYGIDKWAGVLANAMKVAITKSKT